MGAARHILEPTLRMAPKLLGLKSVNSVRHEKHAILATCADASVTPMAVKVSMRALYFSLMLPPSTKPGLSHLSAIA